MNDPKRPTPAAPTASDRRQAQSDSARIGSEIIGLSGQTDPFVSAVRATRMPMIITDPRQSDNPVVFTNNSFCRLTGYAREEILGRNCRFLQGPETNRETVARIRAAVSAVEPIEIDIRNHRKDGTPFWNRLLLAPVHDQAGELAYFFASQVDVTIERERLAGLESDNAALMAELSDRLRKQEEDAVALRAATESSRRAERELAAKALEFETLAENVSQLAWTAEPDGRVTWYNKRWYAYTGTDRETMQRDGWRSVHHPDHVDGIVAEVAAKWASGRSWQAVHLLRAADGSYGSFLTQAEPIRDDAGRLVRWFVTKTNITPQLEAERRLRELNDTLEQRVADEVAERAKTEEQLRQSHKMEAVGQLTGGLAHDFNNLLTGISGSLELLATRIAQGRIGEIDRYVDAAQQAARRAASLTHRLLAFSRRQTLEPRPTDVNRMVSSLDELIRRTVGPSIIVEFVPDQELWPTLVDPSQLENALLNLCINARDAMPSGGKLTIETGNRCLDARGARELDLLPGQYVSLCVSDNGIGMTEAVRERAFDPFFTTKPIGEGTGLGLSMIYGFARQSNGQARIYSELGEGTAVRLYLPRHQGNAEPDGVAAELVDAPRAVSGETVLVVDDEPTVRMLVVEVLEDLGYTAIEAGDGAAGLDILNSGVRLDLLVTDVGLPGGINGREVAEAARLARPDLKVLFITGYAENAVLSHGHLNAGMHVLTKPFALEALASRIKEMIAG